MDLSFTNNTSPPGVETILPGDLPQHSFVLEQLHDPARTVGRTMLTTTVVPPGITMVNTSISPRPSAPLLNSTAIPQFTPAITSPTSGIRRTPTPIMAPPPPFIMYYFGRPYPYSPYSSGGPPFAYNTHAGPYTPEAPAFYYESTPMPFIPPMSAPPRPLEISQPPIRPAIIPATLGPRGPPAQDCRQNRARPSDQGIWISTSSRYGPYTREKPIPPMNLGEVNRIRRTVWGHIPQKDKEKARP